MAIYQPTGTQFRPIQPSRPSPVLQDPVRGVDVGAVFQGFTQFRQGQQLRLQRQQLMADIIARQQKAARETIKTASSLYESIFDQNRASAKAARETGVGLDPLNPAHQPVLQRIKNRQDQAQIQMLEVAKRADRDPIGAATDMSKIMMSARNDVESDPEYLMLQREQLARNRFFSAVENRVSPKVGKGKKANTVKLERVRARADRQLLTGGVFNWAELNPDDYVFSEDQAEANMDRIIEAALNETTVQEVLSARDLGVDSNALVIKERIVQNEKDKAFKQALAAANNDTDIVNYAEAQGKTVDELLLPLFESRSVSLEMQAAATGIENVDDVNRQLELERRSELSLEEAREKAELDRQEILARERSRARLQEQSQADKLELESERQEDRLEVEAARQRRKGMANRTVVVEEEESSKKTGKKGSNKKTTEESEREAKKNKYRRN